MEIVQSEKNGIRILQLSGNLLGETYGTALMDTIRQSTESGLNKFILDVGGLKFVNSTGIGILISAMTRARNAGGDLSLLNVPEQLKKMLVMTKLDGLFHLSNQEEEAISLLNKNG